MAPPTLSVKLENGRSIQTDFCFEKPFRIGRGEGCDIRIEEDVVSRVHAEATFSDGRWQLKDLGSSNGIWVDDVRTDAVFLDNNCRVMLGENGPVLAFFIQTPPAPPQPDQVAGPVKPEPRTLTIEHYKKHYFSDTEDGNAGEHTLMMRSAFAEVKKKQKRMYLFIIAVTAGLCLITGAYAVVKHLEIQKQKKLAEEIFYSMKSLELEFADLLDLSRETADERVKKRVAAYQARRNEMVKNYDRFVSALNTYENEKDEQGRLILKVARMFGECEINIPDGFRKEVNNYINKWKATPRLENAVRRALENGYVPRIIETMKSFELAPQFFYLGLQESNFDVYACGPKTRFGIAKGAWQFIPPTAEEYGLRVGPLAGVSMPDPHDERHDFDKSTNAAARYLRHIYNTKAQASGLLVIASYNWGQTRVIRLIEEMPENPRERNFWNILKNNKDRIPKETYDYVFYIFSAAVIGENPRLFGFNFDNPLKPGGQV